MSNPDLKTANLEVDMILPKDLSKIVHGYSFVIDIALLEHFLRLYDGSTPHFLHPDLIREELEDGSNGFFEQRGLKFPTTINDFVTIQKNYPLTIPEVKTIEISLQYVVSGKYKGQNKSFPGISTIEVTKDTKNYITIADITEQISAFKQIMWKTYDAGRHEPELVHWCNGFTVNPDYAFHSYTLYLEIRAEVF